MEASTGTPLPGARFFFEATACHYPSQRDAAQHARRAEALAKAEALYVMACRWLRLELAWESDLDAWMDYQGKVRRGHRKPGMTSIERCILALDREPLASLRCIECADEAARRLVQAELVLASRDRILKALDRAMNG